MAALVVVRVFAAPPTLNDVIISGLVLVVGAAGVIHRRAIEDLDLSRRHETETFARILQGLSRSVSPDAIVNAIVDELGAAAGADHTVVVRLRPEPLVLEATLVSSRVGVPSSTTVLPLVDLEDPESGDGRIAAARVPVAVPIWSRVDDLYWNDQDLDEGRAAAWAPVMNEPSARAAGGSRAGRAAWGALQLVTAGSTSAAPAAFRLDSGRAAAVPSLRVGEPQPDSSRRVAERIATRVRTFYGLKNTIQAPLVTDRGVVGAIVLSRRTSRAWSPPSIRVLAGAAVEASAALERAYSHREAEARASTDALTGLPNRRYFDEFCGLLARRRRAEDAVGVLMIDIDHFKRLNDEFGHPVGDQVLRAVAAAITRAVREGDVPARYGGEEFVVLLRNPLPGVAPEIAERVRRSVAALDLTAFGPRGVTVSIGYAVGEEPDDAIPDLVDQADQALYRAKRAGRDRVVAA